MHDLASLLLPWLAGVALAGFCFGGLWWTIRQAAVSPSPARWFLASAVLRMGGVLAGFMAVMAGDWQRGLWCLLGFVIGRQALLRLLSRQSWPKGMSHAP